MKFFVFFIMTAALFFGCNKETNDHCNVVCPVTDVVVPSSDEDNPIMPGRNSNDSRQRLYRP